jgi:uncharacterized protein YeaO (DUF488 family)
VGDVRISRVYDHDEMRGAVFFVERLWPRGVRRDQLPEGSWVKDVAPSGGLRAWYAHDPQKWEEFRRRYVGELDAHPETWQPLVEAASAGDVTLVFSARDRDHNSAVVLREYLLAHLNGREDGRDD